MIQRNTSFWFGILIATVAFQAFGWMMLLQSAQNNAKISAQHEIQARPSEVSELVLPAAMLQGLWVERNEIQYQGRMFDVISSEYFQDSVRLVVFHDLHEEGILHTLKVIWGQKKGQHPRDWQHTQAHSFFVPFLAPVIAPFTELQRLEFVQSPHHFFFPVAEYAPVILAPPPKPAQV